jgi:TonB family protein
MLRRLTPLPLAAALLAGGATLLTPDTSEAFCGFYVAGADAELYNNATVVVLMRAGTRTVLSMQNDYQGPPEDFALVVPVPVVLKEADVKVLRKELFERVEALAAPRLVQYWEQDPCRRGTIGLGNTGLIGRGGGGGTGSGYGRGGEPPTVVVEAEFVVGEYEIVILSATESNGLDSWLRTNGYNIPAGAEPLLRPYVEQGMKFFVAKVDPKKVEFDEQGHAQLSPLRFHYDTEEFSLPIRLGLINAPDPNSGGAQDLLVHVLAPNQRYEVANYPNVTIPTNLDVENAVREQFGAFYVSLFDHTLAQHPGAVMTEYAWGASSCDPCPGPQAALTPKELTELGADVLDEGDVGAVTSSPPLPIVRQAKPSVEGPLDRDIIRRIIRAHINEVRSCYGQGLRKDPTLAGRVVIDFEIESTGKVDTSSVRESTLSDASVGNCIGKAVRRWKFPRPRGGGEVEVSYPFNLSGRATSGYRRRLSNFVLTRLHARYDASSLGEDLVFRAAEPIVGGREFAAEDGVLERGAKPSSVNNFQGRYTIRHPWTGPIGCSEPQRGVWGGPPAGEQGSDQPVVARELTKVARGASLASFVTAGSAAQLGLDDKAASASPETPATTKDTKAGGAGDDVSNQHEKAQDQREKPQGCSCTSADTRDPSGGAPASLLVSLLGLLGLGGLRRRHADA